MAAKVGDYTKRLSDISRNGCIPTMKIPTGPRVASEDFYLWNILGHCGMRRQNDQTSNMEEPFHFITSQSQKVKGANGERID